MTTKTFPISKSRVLISPLALLAGLASYAPAHAQEAVLIQNGDIRTEKVELDGDGDSLSIENGGTLNVDGDDGVLATGADVVVTNDGLIDVNGFNAGGIFSSGANGVNTNNGTIVTAGGEGDGIVSTGPNATNTNTGTISTDGIDADGILSFNAGATNTNTGTITTKQFGSGGLFSRGANTTNTNSGKIITEGSESDGLLSTGTASANINTGSVMTSGFDSDGIFSIGTDATNINKGDIVTTGDLASGIFSSGANAVNVNSGSIKTSGAQSHAVVLEGTNASLNNTGLLWATGTDSLAVIGGSGTQTVTLGEGSVVIGGFDLGGGADTVNFENAGAGVSAVLKLENVETLNITGDDRPIFVTENGDDVITLVDPTGFSVLGDATSLLAENAHRTLQQQATSGTWASAFGANRSRDDDGATLAYDTGFAGIMAGYETDLGANRFGFVGGVSLGQTSTEIDATEIATESVFGGAYLKTALGAFDLTTSLLAGVEQHESDRIVADNLAGFETANATIDGSFVSAGAQVAGTAFTFGALSLRPSFSAAYTLASYDRYTEEGTTNANLEVESRTTQSLNARAQLESVSQVDGIETAFRFGIKGRATDADDIAVTLNDVSQSFTETDTDAVLGGFVGARAVFSESDAMRVTGDVEYGFADGGEDTVAAGLQVSFRF